MVIDFGNEGNNLAFTMENFNQIQSSQTSIMISTVSYHPTSSLKNMVLVNLINKFIFTCKEKRH